MIVQFLFVVVETYLGLIKVSFLSYKWDNCGSYCVYP